MNKKRIVCLAICLVLAFSLLSGGCSRESASNYVTLGTYKGLEVTILSTEVTQKDIDDEILAMRLSYSTETNTVTTRGAQMNDTVNIDYVGKIDGVAFDGGTDTGYNLTLGSHAFIEGFEEDLIGALTGTTVDVTVTFPDPYQSADLAGKDAVFSVKVNSITEPVLPKYDDAFVAQYTNQKTVAEFESYLREHIADEKQNLSHNTMNSDLWAKITANSTINSYPEDEINDYINNAKQYYTDSAKQGGYADLNTYVQTLYGIDEAQLMTFIEESAYDDIGYNLVVRAIAEAEGLRLTLEDYKNGVQDLIVLEGYTDAEAFTEANGMPIEEFYGQEEISNFLLAARVLELVAENAIKTTAS